jgi:PhoPQ-activated pathogenicity-related protein
MANFVTFASLFAFICVNFVRGSSPLDDYVNAPDSHYKYELIKTYELVGYKLYVLNMTSQKWLDETIVSNPVWWHYLSITVPDEIERPDAAFVFIDGGSNTDP